MASGASMLEHLRVSDVRLFHSHFIAQGSHSHCLILKVYGSTILVPSQKEENSNVYEQL